MPRMREGYQQLATQIPSSLFGRLEGLTATTGRSIAVEVAHALERHLDHPPVVRVEATELPPVEIEAQPAPKARRGRPRKEAI